MFRRLTATAAAAALVLTTLAPTGAFAMTDQQKQLLALVLGAVAIGAVVHEADRKKDKREKEKRKKEVRHDDGWHLGNDRRLLPSECVFTVERQPAWSTGNRLAERQHYQPEQRRVVSRECLADYRLSRDLPRGCAFEAEVGWDRETVYGAECLRRNGFRFASLR